MSISLREEVSIPLIEEVAISLKVAVSICPKRGFYIL